MAPPELAQLVSVERDDVPALEEDLSTGDLGGGPQNAQYGVRDGALAAARLAAQPHDLTRLDRKVHMVDGTDAPVLEHIVDDQVL
jgi:hypothetical protein